jgi:hypothetical protein
MADILTGITNALGGNIATGIADIIRLFKVDPNVALQQQEQLAQIQASIINKSMDSITAQIQVNQTEAANKSIFIAGWRPFIGWICGSAMAYKFVVQPLLVFILVATHSTFDASRLPVLDWAEMSTVLLGMLGLAGARTWEKLNGVSSV